MKYLNTCAFREIDNLIMECAEWLETLVHIRKIHYFLETFFGRFQNGLKQNGFDAEFFL